MVKNLLAALHTLTLKGHLHIRGHSWLSIPRNLAWEPRDQQWVWIQIPIYGFSLNIQFAWNFPQTLNSCFFSLHHLGQTLYLQWHHFVTEGIECLNIALEFSHFLTYPHVISVHKSPDRSILLRKTHFSLPPFLSLEKSTWTMKLHFLCDWKKAKWGGGWQSQVINSCLSFCT